ncbi:MAG TPA: RNA methyltransferase [Edaphocola sp.]|nr:RNA methyltransferase [Edaphocola sp.]
MSQTQIKFIQSLSRQKYRKAHNAYLVEGSKNAKEWLASPEKINIIAALPEWLAQHQNEIAQQPKAVILPLKEFELQKISTLKTPQSVVLVVEKPEQTDIKIPKNRWSLYLEEIKDPGNMGTIIRIADWFGVQQIFYSENCVEIYNPKVVQASMGSLIRVATMPCPAEQLYNETSADNLPLYAASLEGRNLKNCQPDRLRPGIIAMGNESLGLSRALQDHAHFKLKIPGKGQAESLNVAVATGILCSWLT